MIPRSKRPPYCEEHTQSKVTALNKEYDRQRDPKLKAFYSSSRWQRFRLIVLNKYHWLCQLQHEGCNTTADTVHHIVEVRTDWNKRFEVENCIPVCRSCHEKEHDRFS